MTTQETKVKKTHYGWNCTTIVNKNGFNFEVSTLKIYSGKIVASAQKLLNHRENNQVQVISFTMFDSDPDNRIYLVERKEIATESNIKKIHAEALAIFENYELKDKVKKEPGINTIFWLEGYGHYKNEVGNEWICYEVKKDQWGTTYKCVEPTDLIFKNIDHPRHESKKFGIGHYFNDTYIFAGDQDFLNNIIIDAHEATKVREEAAAIAAAESKKAEEEKQKFLSQYERADVRKTGTLIKNYAKSLGLTVTSVKYDSFSMGNSYDVTYQGPEKNETFENLCKNLEYSCYNAYEDYWGSRDLEPVILDGFILHEFKYVHVYFKEIEPQETEPQETEPQETTENNINLILSDYSEKAIVLRGDTKAIKDQLKQLGGSFNFKLKGGAGWIFSKKRESEIKNIFNI